MDLIGKGYAKKYCTALFQKKREELAYRVYVTDTLMALVNSTKVYSVESRFYDTRPGKRRKSREKTAGEIVAETIKKAGLTLGGS